VLANLPTIPPWLVDGIAGAGDSLTTVPFTSWSLTEQIRKRMGTNGQVNQSSRSYKVGGWTGTSLSVAIAAGGTATAAAVADGKAGAYFGRGTASVFNVGKVRFGWYWEVNRDAIGLRIGAARGTSWYSHIPFWYPK